jgi:antitoxin component YwqK of YwqJK toxin-antitoxin module
MNLIELPVTIIDTIISNIKDSESYASLRISCKSLYYLMNEVKRYYNNKNVKELFIFTDTMLNGFHIKWYINTKVSSMVLYENSQKQGDQTYYYPSGHIKCFQEWKDGDLYGFERQYTNGNQRLAKLTEYKYNVKVNEELIYNKKGQILFRKQHLNKDIYKMTFNDNEYKLIEGTFINNKLHGYLTITYLNPNNLSYIRINKYIYKYDYGNLRSLGYYDDNNLLEEVNIKNGKKHGWAYKWHHSHKLKCLAFFNENKYEKSVKLWDETGGLSESLSFINNKPNGVYKSVTKYTTKIIPYVNGEMHGLVKEKIKCINLNYDIAFLKNQFAHTIKKTNDIFRDEIYLDIDYFSFTKYRFNKKIYSFRLLTNYMELNIFDKHELCCYSYSKIISFNEYTDV